MQINPSGYSETPLAKKLGIKNGFRVRIVNQPDYYFELFKDLPKNIAIINDTKTKKNFIHYFAGKARELEKDLPGLKNEIEQDGIIWISWHKKASKIPTDITEDVVRKAALFHGLVDVKVCAIDNTWSGLKLVIPLKLRAKK